MGSQDAPIGRNVLLLSQQKPGMIEYSGGNSISIVYGPKITEPMPGAGSIVAMVDKADLDKFYQAGRAVWHAQYMTKVLPIMVARRKE